MKKNVICSKLIVVAQVFALMLACTVFLRAYDPESKPFDFGVSLGMLGSGSFQGSWYSDFPADSTISESSSPSLMGMAMYDYYIRPYLAVGASLVYAAIVPRSDINWYDNGYHHVDMNDIFILDYCLGIKYRQVLGGLIAVKPGLYLGLRNSFSHNWEAREIGMAIDGSVEFQLFIKDNLYTFIDFGFLSQPYGGIMQIAYVRGGPIYYFTVGLGI